MYKADPEGNKHMRAFFRNFNLNKKRAAAEMLRIMPSQCLEPVAPKQFIDRSNKFFDMNQQKYVKHEIEIKTKRKQTGTRRKGMMI